MLNALLSFTTEILGAAWELIGVIAYYCADSFWEL